jgi:hypothetical protein
MKLREIDREDFMKQAQDHVQAVELTALNFRPALPESYLVDYLKHKPKKLNSVAFSPQANYTDQAIAACRRS